MLGLCLLNHADDEMQFTKGTGDLGQYIIQQALKCGAKTVRTNDLPPIKGEWKYSEDQYGVVVQLGKERFEEVQTFLRKAFGPPAQEPDATTDGGKLGWYAARTTGIGLHFGYNKERTQVIILRPQKGSEVYKRAAEFAITEEEKKLYREKAEEAKKHESKLDKK